MLAGNRGQAPARPVALRLRDCRTRFPWRPRSATHPLNLESTIMRLPPLVPRIRTTALGLTLVAVCATTAFTQAPAAGDRAAGTGRLSPEPPVLDRELFFGNPEITGAQTFARRPIHRLHQAVQGHPERLGQESGRAVRCRTPDHRGSRNGRSRATSGAATASTSCTCRTTRATRTTTCTPSTRPRAPAAGQDAPAARNLTDAKGARALIYSVPKRTPDVIYVGLNDRDAAWHDVYRVSLASGERTLLRKNGDRIAGWVFDQRGELRLGLRTTDTGDTEILAISGDTLKPVYTCSVLESCGPVRFHKDNVRVYVQSNKGDANDFVRLVLIEAATRHRGSGRHRPARARGLRRGRVLGGDGRTDCHLLRGRPQAVLLPGQGGGGRLQPGAEATARQGPRVHVGDRGRTAVAAVGLQRRRARRNLPVRSRAPRN